MTKLIKNTITETYCVKHCYQDTPKHAVYGEEGAVSIKTKIKSEDTEITDTKDHRHVITALVLRAGSSCRRGDRLKCFS